MSLEVNLQVGLIGLIIAVQIGCCMMPVEGNSRPHIVTILADDMGWNDVGFHGSNQIPTPNIDALAYNGVILNRHYTMPTCTPSRTAFLTGKYPIRTGMQGFPLMADEPRGLPLTETILPQRLKQLGYTTRIIGKWHQGSYKSEYTPTRRGFDSFLGYWNGFMGYFNHTNHEAGYRGYDFRRDNCTTWDYFGRYATDVFTEEAETIINNHDTTQPLYLHIAHLAPHTGNNDDPLEVPDVEEAHRKFSYISTPERRLYAEMVSQLDISVGRVVKALADRGVLNNTVVIFMSDNGAQTRGWLFSNFGSNWPLRGMKFTAHEGGVRCVAAIWSPLFQDPGRVSSHLFHLVDWLPTLYAAAGGDVSDLGLIDGIDQWASLVSNAGEGPRSQVLINIDEVQNLEALIDGKWKLSRGDFGNGVSDGYYGDDGLAAENPDYNISEILTSDVNLAILKTHPRLITNTVAEYVIDASVINKLRSGASVNCPNMQELDRNDNYTQPHVKCVHYCLYDIHADPCETNNVAAQNVEVLEKLVDDINRLRSESVPQLNKEPDPAADPGLYNNTWVSWLDDRGSHPEQCKYVNAHTELSMSRNASVCASSYYILFLLSLAVHC